MIPRLCTSGTVVCLATGPSLTRADIEQCLRKTTIVAVNDAYRLCPEADVLYAADARWWRWHGDALGSFRGMKVSIAAKNANHPRGVLILHNTGEGGVDTDPSGLRTGRNSGYQAINLAVHLGAKRIVLLGYDMRLGPNGEHHFFGEHKRLPKAPPLSTFVPHFEGLVNPLKALGIEIVNCSRRTALTCFPCAPLESVLTQAVAA